MLSATEQETIISEFPNIKLSYENITHKKVYQSDILMAIPAGKKCFVWFTEYEDERVCFLMELGEKKQIKQIQTYLINTFNDCVASHETKK